MLAHSLHGIGRRCVRTSTVPGRAANEGFSSRVWRTPGSDCLFFGWFELSPVAADFVSESYKPGWVQWPDFDCVTWKNSTEARQLYFGPAALETDTPEQLGRLLSALIRQDRFVGGALNAAFQSRVL